MLSNRRRKTSARRVELSRRVVEHLVDGHDYAFLDGFAAGEEERSLEDVADIYRANLEFIENANRQRRGPFTRSAAWWALIGVPKFGPRKQIVASERVKPMLERGYIYGLPQCWRDQPDVGSMDELYESEREYLIRNQLLTEEEQQLLAGEL